MIKDGFSILLLAEDAIQLFGERLKLSHIAAVPQAHCCPRLILNLLAQPESDTPSVNDITNREAALQSLQFGRAFPCILQALWEAEPVQGLVWVSKMDVTDAYHRGTVEPAQVGAFTYVIPSAPENEGIVICINLVLPMGWVDSPNLFCAFWEPLTDVENALVDTDFPVPSYGAILEIPSTGTGPPHTLQSLTHIDCYMDDVISVVYGGPDCLHQVFDGTVRALKWLFLSLPVDTKDSVSV